MMTAAPRPAGTTDSIKPYFFGAPSSQLFACYHAPRGGASQHGVVLCYPTGHEYIRTHRVYRLLADRLAKAGFHVLRFDYFGTGDSAGDFEAASLRRWIDDSAAAVEELGRGFGVRHVYMAGLRMGATLAMLAGAEHGGLAGIVLWDAVVRGSEYLAEVMAIQHEMARSATGGGNSKDVGRPRELVGFPMTTVLVDELQGVDLLGVTRPPARKALVVDSAEEPLYQRLRRHLETSGLQAHYEHVPSPRPWTQDPYKLVLPSAIIEKVVVWTSAQKQ